jgi:hypothetical protein
MPRIDTQEANAALARAVAALNAVVNIDIIKAADDERVEKFVATLRECHECFETDIDTWIEDYQRRKREEMEE